jgi:RHS repeat-associated protein
MIRNIRRIAAFAAVVLCRAAFATTDWSTQDYDLYPGDFDGDGKTDVLYIAKDPSRASGIALSDGTGPNIPFQSWPSNYLGIPWYGNHFNVIVADFNGPDVSGHHHADIFLQSAGPGGDSYLLLSNDEGKIVGISQTLTNGDQGVDWSGDKHRIVAGDFNLDGFVDLFLQATSRSGVNYVMLANSAGKFQTSPAQSWTDSPSPGGFKWSTQDALVFAADFNADGRTDLLVQAKPQWTLIDFDISIPVPTYPPNLNGVVLAQNSATIFSSASMKAWSRNANGVDWSTLNTNLVVGDFNGDGRADVLLQSKNSSRPSYLLSEDGTANIFGTGGAISANVAIDGGSARLFAAKFGGSSSGASLYVQALQPGGTNSIASSVTTTISAATHDPSNATGTLPASAVGVTPASFAVSDQGAATYSIPIVVPPGVGRIQPSLSITYQSTAGNGQLGVGWGLAGFSAIERCPRTMAQDASTDGVHLTVSDRFCLDGNKLRLTAGTYGASGSTYQTELEQFSLITAQGTAGNGPAYFVVQAKNGLTYEFGNSADSRIESTASGFTTTARTWALNKVSDRHGNAMTITYQEDGAGGSFRPLTVNYTSNASAGLTAAYRVNFVWQTRPTSDTLVGYFAGGKITETQRLSRIETQYNDPAVGNFRLVRSYRLGYNTSGSTPRSRLSAVQECDRNGYCLSPTMISWQDGLKGWSSTEVVSSSDPTAQMTWSYAIDFDGDGRTDLIYPQAESGVMTWYFMHANTSGTFDAPVSTHIGAGDWTNLQWAKGLAIDYFSNGRTELLLSIPGQTTRQLLGWNGSTLALTNTNITQSLSSAEWVADLDGDGRVDFLYATPSGSNNNISLQLNTGYNSSTGKAEFGTASSVATVPFSGAILNPALGGQASPLARVMDFNGDGRGDIVYMKGPDTTCNTQTFSCTTTATYGVLLSTGAIYVNGPTYNCYSTDSDCPMPTVGDFNGDGITDLFMTSGGNGGYNSYFIAFGSGAGLVTGSNVNVPGNMRLSGWGVADLDGDGRDDLLYYLPSSSNFNFARSTGTDFDNPVAQSLVSGSVNNARLLDLDGDGQLDVGYQNSQFRVVRHNGVSQDLVSSITDGFGNSVSPVYGLLTDASVYTVGTSATFPNVDITRPAPVVKQYVSTDGVGGSYSVSASYQGAMINLQGRGFLGFTKRSLTDGRTGVKTEWTYNQTFPKIGLPSEVKETQSNGKTVTDTVSAYTDLQTSTVANNDRHFPYLSGSTRTEYEVSATNATVDGQAIRQVVTSSTLNSTGTLTDMSVTTTDQTGSGQSFTTHTVNTVVDDSGNWCLGFITQQDVTNTIPGPVSLTRTTQYVKDSANLAKCRRSQEILGVGSTLTQTSTYAYDSFGNVNSVTTSATNAPNRTASTNYGTQGVFQTTATNALGEVTTNTWDYALGVQLTSTDPNGLAASLQYDGFGRRTLATAPDGTSTSWTFSSCGAANGYCGNGLLRYKVLEQKLDSTSSSFRYTTQLYDAMGRVKYSQAQAVSGALSSVATDYDSLGRVYHLSAPYFAGAPVYYRTRSWDILGRLVREDRPVSDSDPTVQSMTMAYARLSTTFTDPKGGTTMQLSDALGKPVQVTDAAGSNTYYTYDPFSNLLTTRDNTNTAASQITNTYHIRGFLMTTSDPDMGGWTYVRDGYGQLTQQTDAKTQATSFTYDALSRPLTRVEPEGTTTWTYGTLADNTASNKYVGRLKSVSAPGGYQETNVFDAKGRPQTVTFTEDTAYQLDYAYNNQGQLDTLTYPTSTSSYRLKLQFAYGYGLLNLVRDFNASSTVFWALNASDSMAHPIDESYGNGLRVITGYDTMTGTMYSRQSGTGGSTTNVQSESYTHDKNGNVTQRHDGVQGLTESFIYDSLNRLDYSTLQVGAGAATTNLDVTINAIGNTTAKSDVGSYDYATAQAGCTYYSYTQPHAVRNAGGSAYCYDPNGNMTSRAGVPITWTSFNQPNQIGSGSNSSQFSYNADRQRWRQIASYGGTSETTIYVGSLLEKVTRGAVTEYKHYIPTGSATTIYTRRSDSTTSTYYVAQDHLGSTDVVTDGSGATVLRESFAAYGGRRGSTWSGAQSGADQTAVTSTTRHGFTGHEMLDNLNLVNMNGRIFDPSLGRFASADPFIQQTTNSQSLNRYSYVMNQPLTLTDPSGFFSLGDLLNPFSRKNPLSPASTIGRYLLAFPVVAPLIGALGGPPSIALTYYSNKVNDRLMVQYPLLADAEIVAACYWGGPWGCAGASAHVTRINGGSLKDILVAAAVAYVGSEISAHYGDTYSFERLAVESVFGGVTSYAEGGDFRRGFWISFGTNASAWIYQAYVKYDATYESGGDAVRKLDDKTPPQEGANNFGLIKKIGDNGPFKTCSEGDGCSRFFNDIPGMNAIAGMHDMMMTSVRGTWGTIFNVPLMPPAALISAAAVVGAQPGWTQWYLVVSERRRDGGN